MLNISPNSIEKYINKGAYGAFTKTAKFYYPVRFARILGVVFLLACLFLFLPWTQNIRAKGKVTTLNPEQRPQTIHATIPGRIEKWFVKEGDLVHKGDTIVFISEIKEDYMDPNLLERMDMQVKAKESSITSYQQKINALNQQIDALNEAMRLKMDQAKNKIRQSDLKVKSDSVEFEAAITNFSISQEQFKRYEELLQKGIISQTDLESRKLKLQEATAKKISAENKLMASRNEYINTIIELNAIKSEYNDKLMKAESDKYSAISMLFDTEANVAKLQNQYSNYSIRSSYYFITAPQEGYVTKALTQGIGETIKEGTPVVSIMPARPELAVELYIEPMDLPLVQKGQKIRFIFDGWPSFVFSGWPGASFGTFGGEIMAIDKMISPNGKFRILVKSDKTDEPWPTSLQVGGGATGMALLNDVPLWYELWRQLNGFPPAYYETDPTIDQKNSEEKEKK